MAVDRTTIPSGGLDRERVPTPRRQIEVKPLRRKLSTVAFKPGISEEVSQHDPASEAGERNLRVALRWSRTIVHGREQTVFRVFPGHHDEAIPSRVLGPSCAALAQLPIPLVDLFARKH